MSYVSRVVIACNADGTFSNAAIHESEVVDGKVYDLDPRAIYASDVALLEPYLGAAGSAAVATLGDRDANITTLTSERDEALKRVAELEKQLAPPPVLVPTTEFVLRFDGTEFDAIKTLAETDGAVAGFLARTRQADPINVASPTFTAAMQYLVAKGVVASDRVASLSAPAV